tara:strand:+ start:852 stop:1241 length:390 start_codon:yes stop_codon:yes gene_type:complete
MAHYAFLDGNNIVTEVITGIDEDKKDDLPKEFSSWEEFYGNFRGQTCKRTSYNTYGNEHKSEGTAFRGNYAGIGFTYDTENDVFIPPKPFNSWVLDESKWVWKAPVDEPDDGKAYFWNDNKGEWEEISE